MISGLLIINSPTPGARDIHWDDDPTPGVAGYNVYRSEDHQYNWVRINQYPVPGNRYRDQVSYQTVTYDCNLEKDWVEMGQTGSYRIRVPGATFWSSEIQGKATLAENTRDVILMINGHPVAPSRVIGAEGEVWLPTDRALPGQGATNEVPIWSLPSLQSVSVVYQKLVNSVNPYMATQTFYTVVPVDFQGRDLHLPGLPGTEVRGIMDVDSMDYMQREMVRRNAWLFEQVGEPAWLMLRKTRGEVCSCVNPETHDPRTACTSCFETGIFGGYYGPLDFLFIDPDQAMMKTVDEGGVKVERQSRSYLGPAPIVKNGDLIIRKNGERLVIGDVTYKSPRGVLLQQEFDASLLPPGSTKYLIPINPQGYDPTSLYNPAFAEDKPFIPGEPVSDPRTDPTKVWENPTVPKGRTTTFGRIMT